MWYGTPMKTTSFSLVILVALVFFPFFVQAKGEFMVGGKLIDEGDPGITEAHGEVCTVRHYHGVLDGVADPQPNGCGHGEVLPSTSPVAATKTESLPARFFAWVGSFFSKETKETVVNVIDVAAEANGLPPPGTVSDAVDIVKDAAPSIKEKIDNIEEYRESAGEEDNLGIYNNLDKVSENPTISERFFRWFNSLVK